MSPTNRCISTSVHLVLQILRTRKIEVRVRRPLVRYPDVSLNKISFFCFDF